MIAHSDFHVPRKLNSRCFLNPQPVFIQQESSLFYSVGSYGTHTEFIREKTNCVGTCLSSYILQLQLLQILIQGPDLSIANLEHVTFKKHQPTLFNHLGRKKSKQKESYPVYPQGSSAPLKQNTPMYTSLYLFFVRIHFYVLCSMLALAVSFFNELIRRPQCATGTCVSSLTPVFSTATRHLHMSSRRWHLSRCPLRVD